MADDVDDLLRRAMATLDRQIPPGYFDALPGRTLARLDDPAISDAPVMAVGDDDARDAAASASLPGSIVEPGAGPIATPVVTPVVTPLRPRRSRRGRIISVAAIAVAAAAGVVLVVSGDRRDRASEALAVEPQSATAGAPRAGAVANEQAIESSKAALPASRTYAQPKPEPELDALQKQEGAERAKRDSVKTKTGKPIVPPSKTLVGKKPAHEPVTNAFSAGEQPADQVQRVKEAVSTHVYRCASDQKGTVTLRLRLQPSGRAASVAVTGTFAGTPLASCIERSVARATFPSLRGAAQDLEYSYALPQ